MKNMFSTITTLSLSLNCVRNKEMLLDVGTFVLHFKWTTTASGCCWSNADVYEVKQSVNCLSLLSFLDSVNNQIISKKSSIIDFTCW